MADDVLPVSERHINEAKKLAAYAGFKFAADHLDMAIEATAQAFARFERDLLASMVRPDSISEGVDAELAALIDSHNRLLRSVLAAIDTGRSEPLFIVRDLLRNHLAGQPSLSPDKGGEE
jgi:hypothetical protein